MVEEVAAMAEVTLEAAEVLPGPRQPPVPAEAARTLLEATLATRVMGELAAAPRVVRHCQTPACFPMQQS
jgi:hypothetical protein